MIARDERTPPATAGTRSVGRVRSLPFDGDDEALVGALREGRADAAAAFYDRHAKGIHGIVFRLMGPDRDRDDVVHDVFVRALESLPLLRDPSALRSWLFGIAVRTVRIRFQKRSRQRWLRFMAPEDVPDLEGQTPDVEIGEALREVYALLGGMDSEERIALVLHRVEGLSLQEAADAMETSLATLRRRLARAEGKLVARAKNRPALGAWIAEGDMP